MHINILATPLTRGQRLQGEGHGGGREWGKAVASHRAGRRSSRPSNRLGGFLELAVSDFV